MGKRSNRLVGAVCCVLALGTIPAAAQSNAEPYAGKQVRMIIGFSSGIYDQEIATDLQISYLSLWTTWVARSSRSPAFTRVERCR